MTAAVLLLLSLAPAAAGQGRSQGRVLSVTEARAYLDAGSEEGLVPGAVLQLVRHGRPAGDCRVEEASDHHASCAGAGFRVGDTFALPAQPAAKVAELPPPLPAEEVARLLAVVQAAPIALVTYQAQPGAAAAREVTGEVVLGFASWMSNVAAPDQQARLDLSIRGAEIGRDLRLHVDLTALRWTRRTSTEFIPGPDTQLLVWQAEAAWRDPGRSFDFELGRVRPWLVPGATVFDGAQAGFRLGRADVGLFGGLVPDPWTTSPAVDRYTGGAFWALETRLGSSHLRHEGRLAIVHSPELGSRIEGEVDAGLWVSRALDVSGEVRVAAGDRRAPGYLDQARLALSGRPFDALSFAGGFGYVGLSTPLASIVRATWPGPSRRGDLMASVDVWRFLTVSATGGFAEDIGSGLRHGWAGPEVSCPRFFTPRVVLSAGWLADLGWLKGQNAYVQASTRPADAVRILARFSWFRDDRAAIPGSHDDQFGLHLSGSVDLTRWLAFRLSVLARSGAYLGPLDGYGFSSLASLAGSL